jgi:hypothetical protein
MYTENIANFFEQQAKYLLIVDQVLDSWTGESYMQTPDLLSQVQELMGWSDKQLRMKESIIKEYVRNHSKWYITTGSRGGIRPRDIKAKKDLSLEIKNKFKEEITATINANLAKKTPTLASILEEDEEIEDKEESDFEDFDSR